MLGDMVTEQVFIPPGNNSCQIALNEGLSVIWIKTFWSPSFPLLVCVCMCVRAYNNMQYERTAEYSYSTPMILQICECISLVRVGQSGDFRLNSLKRFVFSIQP